jgi:hypothetical protein
MALGGHRMKLPFPIHGRQSVFGVFGEISGIVEKIAYL